MATKKATAKKTTAPKKSAPQVKSPAKSKPAAKPVTKNSPKTTGKSKITTSSITQSPLEKNAPEIKELQSNRSRKYLILAIVLIVVLGALLYIYRGLFVAAVVNGQPISRWSVIQQTEKQAGKQALNTLVRNTLIEQEAQKEHVTVSDQEVNDEMKTVQNNLSKQGQNLNQVLALQGMTMNDLRNLVRLDKLVSKMVGKDIKVSDKDVNDYIDKNRDLLPKDQSEDQLKKTVAAQLKQQQLNTKVQAWLTDVQNKAKIIYFVQY